MMERRYEAYKDVVVRPFYREHFARLDRQIVLVDALAAFNAGPDAVRDLESALAAILGSFRTGRTTIESALFRPRIDRILFAATKADHLHHTSHDRLERFLARITERALAERVFKSPPTVSDRLLRLQEQGVIKRYVALLDREKIGVPVMARAD